MNKTRCVIYTRKSSEEGLEQDFNSLDAQFEACSAYVASQASEGWSLLSQRYDDGGLSGGSLDRPALRRLLDDIEAGLIDTVVVYKVDRLTRSLFDFAKLVEAFDRCDVSFVSVTQSFNTTTSMGRLTLNMLLSFAQFEREVTAERIRDKIAASKAKGLWMGGPPPMGYRPDGRSLAIVEDHAAIVRTIFERYLDVGSVRLVAATLIGAGIIAPIRTASTGRRYGGKAFTRGQIYKILNNPIYAGRIAHRDKTYMGNHKAIIDATLWDRVQAKLAEGTKGERARSTAFHPSPLAGKLFDQSGQPLVAAHANKKGVRYRYYVSRSLQHGNRTADRDGMRLPAVEIEGLVTRELISLLNEPIALAARLGIELDNEITRRLTTGAALCIEGLQSSKATDRHRILQQTIDRITIKSDAISIRFSTDGVCQAIGIKDPRQIGKADIPRSTVFDHQIKVRLTRSGRAMKLVEASGRAANADLDITLIRAIAKGRRWWQSLTNNPEMSVTMLAKAEGVTVSWITRLIRLSFLAPNIIEQILAGNTPANLQLIALQKTNAIPPRWADQRKLFETSGEHTASAAN